MNNKERFLKLVSDEKTDTIERAKRRIAERREPGILKQLIKEMKNDPWHVRLRRWFRLQRWVWMCRKPNHSARFRRRDGRLDEN